MSWKMLKLYQRFLAVCIISIALCMFIIYRQHPHHSTESNGQVDSLLIREVEHDKSSKPAKHEVEYDRPPRPDRPFTNYPEKPANNSNHRNQAALSPVFGEMFHFALNNSELDFRTNKDFKLTTCPNSIQKKLKESKWASKMYLENITIAMHQGTMSREEYERLHAFGLPFGLSFRDDLLYPDLQNILFQLPYEDSVLDFGVKQKPKCLSCAVVGNGGILNGSKLGKEIDEHHLVFRVNHAIRRGFEEDVGTRTTHYVMMDRSLLHTSKEDVPQDKGIKYVFLPCRRKDYDYINTVIGPANPKRKLNVNAKDMRILHPDFVRYIHKIWMKVKAFRPTTGGMMFMLALHAGCDSVDVYGMGYTKQYSDHYYDMSYIPFKAFLGSHDYRREIQIMKMLDNDGIINWYKRDVKEFL